MSLVFQLDLILQAHLVPCTLQQWAPTGQFYLNELFYTRFYCLWMCVHGWMRFSRSLIFVSFFHSNKEQCCTLWHRFKHELLFKPLARCSSSHKPLCSCLLLVSLAMLQAYLASTDFFPLLLSFFKSPWQGSWCKLQLRHHSGQPETVFISKELTRSPLALALDEWCWSEVFQAASGWHEGLSTTLVTRSSVLERTKIQLGNCAWKIGKWCSSVFLPTCF